MTTLNAQTVALAVLVLTAGCMTPLATTPSTTSTTVSPGTTPASTPTTTTATTTPNTSATATPDEPTVSYVQWRELPSAISSIEVRHDDNETKITQTLNPHNGELRLQIFNSFEGGLENIKEPTNFTAHYVNKGQLVAYVQIQNNSRSVLLVAVITDDGAQWFPDGLAKYDDVARETVRQEAENVSVRFTEPEDSSNDYGVETEGAANGSQIILEQWSTVGNGDDWFVHAVEPTADSHTLVGDDYIRVYYAHGDERVYLGTYDPHNATEASNEY